METKINKLKKIKTFLEKNNKLNDKDLKRKEYITKELRKANDIQSVLYEYNNCKRGIHILVGTVTLVAAFFVTQRTLNLEIVNSILLSLGVSTISAVGTHDAMKHKMNRIQEEHPDIDFENSNYDKIGEKRRKLFKEQFEITQRISYRNKMNKTCAYCVNEIVNSGNTEALKACEILNNKKECNKEVPEETSIENQKIYIMTIK